MNKIRVFLMTFMLMAAAGCTNMNPDVKFDPKADADAYCEIGEKDSKIASRFWDKVQDAYLEKMMYTEYEEFENLIMQSSQAAAQEKPIRDARSSTEVREGEVSYYPEEDAQAYLEMLASDPEKASVFYNQVVESYNTDGLYEDLEIFKEQCGTRTE